MIDKYPYHNEDGERLDPIPNKTPHMSEGYWKLKDVVNKGKHLKYMKAGKTFRDE